MRHALTGTLAVILALAAQAAPATASPPGRQTHPDRRGAPTSQVTPPSQDLRSPDARDAAPPTSPDQDLRSPDARDAAPTGTTAPVPAATVEITAAHGFAWGDALIGAGGALGLLSISLAGSLTLRRRHARRRSTAPVH
jgi:hypothetical protein